MEDFCLKKRQKKSCLSSWKKAISAGSPTVEEILCFRETEKKSQSWPKEIRQKFPEKTQWLYTGYEWSQIQDEEIVSYLDVIVDGKFEAAQKDTKLHWKGSANQKVIDVQNSLNTGKIVLHDV